MRSLNAGLKKTLAAILSALGMAICLSALFLLFPGLAARLDAIVYDQWMKALGKTQPHPAVAIVEIDEKSLRGLGQWPWPRDITAELLEKILAGGAAAVGVDLLLSETDRSSPAFVSRQLQKRFGVGLDLASIPEEARDNDAHFRKIAAEEPVILGAFAFFDGSGELPRSLPPPTGIAERTPAGAPAPRDTVIRASGLLVPIFGDTVPIGILNASVHADGVVRSIPLLVRAGDNIYPALSLRALMSALGQHTMRLDSKEDGLAAIRLGALTIPTEPAGFFRPVYRGPARTFPYYSAADVLSGHVRPEEFRDRIVLVGPTATGLQDMRSTPFDPFMPGVEIHATIIDNILAGQQINILPYDEGLRVILIFATCLATVTIFGFLPAIACASLAGLIVAGSLYGSWHFFENGLFISPVPVLLATLLAGAIVIPWRFWREQSSRKRIKRAFERYVAPEVVRRMISEGGEPLSGQQREASILFTDVRGFTGISEKLAPDQLVKLLNRYFTPMTACVTEREGTLDKFIGDALMAFWNAPLDVVNHQQKAVLAALEMQEKLRRLGPEFRRDFGIELKMGAGLHAGLVHAGNMGSLELLDYTCIGENVNLASRLEGLTRRYGVGIVASASIRKACDGSIFFRPLDVIRVKGSSRPLEIFAPLAAGHVLSGETERQWDEALVAYREGKFALGERLFARLLAWPDLAVAAQLFRERCRDLVRHAPSDWNGVWIYDSK